MRHKQNLRFRQMKKLLIVLLSIGFMSSQTLFGQVEIDQIIELNLKARGGKQLLSELRSIEMEMTMENPMGEITARTYTLNNKATRMEMDIMGTTNYFLVTTEGGWQHFPVQGMKEPKEIDQDRLMKMLKQLDLNGELYDYQNKDQMIEYTGEEDVKGEPCFVLTITSPERPDNPKKVYISQQTHLILKEEVDVETPEGIKTIETLFSDYKTTRRGYVFPMKIESPQGIAKVGKIKVNKDINPAKFKLETSNSKKSDKYRGQDEKGENHDHKGHNH